MKPPTFAPAYVGLFPILAEVAQAYGYALAVHGSVSRDFDLVAIPWVDQAKSAPFLVGAIAAAVNASMGRLQSNGLPLSLPEVKPHGRRSWAIPLECGAVIDLSVLPINKAASSEGERCEHGVQDGDWCEPCNREMKLARRDPQNNNGETEVLDG